LFLTNHNSYNFFFNSSNKTHSFKVLSIRKKWRTRQHKFFYTMFVVKFVIEQNTRMARDKIFHVFWVLTVTFFSLKIFTIANFSSFTNFYYTLCFITLHWSIYIYILFIYYVHQIIFKIHIKIFNNILFYNVYNNNNNNNNNIMNYIKVINNNKNDIITNFILFLIVLFTIHQKGTK